MENGWHLFLLSRFLTISLLVIRWWRRAVLGEGDCDLRSSYLFSHPNTFLEDPFFSFSADLISFNAHLIYFLPSLYLLLPIYLIVIYLFPHHNKQSISKGPCKEIKWEIFHKEATQKYSSWNIVVTVEYKTAITATEQRRTPVHISLGLAPQQFLQVPLGISRWPQQTSLAPTKCSW